MRYWSFHCIAHGIPVPRNQIIETDPSQWTETIKQFIADPFGSQIVSQSRRITPHPHVSVSNFDGKADTSCP